MNQYFLEHYNKFIENRIYNPDDQVSEDYQKINEQIASQLRKVMDLLPEDKKHLMGIYDNLHNDLENEVRDVLYHRGLSDGILFLIQALNFGKQGVESDGKGVTYGPNK